MVKTQVQIPDELYKEAKRVAREREISFAEVVRRGLENIVRCYPPLRGTDWSLPEPRDLGWTGLGHAQVRAALHDDQMPETRRR